MTVHRLSRKAERTETLLCQSDLEPSRITLPFQIRVRQQRNHTHLRTSGTIWTGLHLVSGSTRVSVPWSGPTCSRRAGVEVMSAVVTTCTESRLRLSSSLRSRGGLEGSLCKVRRGRGKYSAIDPKRSIYDKPKALLGQCEKVGAWYSRGAGSRDWRSLRGSETEMVRFVICDLQGGPVVAADRMQRQRSCAAFDGDTNLAKPNVPVSVARLDGQRTVQHSTASMVPCHRKVRRAMEGRWKRLPSSSAAWPLDCSHDARWQLELEPLSQVAPFQISAETIRDPATRVPDMRTSLQKQQVFGTRTRHPLCPSRSPARASPSMALTRLIVARSRASSSS